MIVCGDAHRNKPLVSDFPDSPLVEYTAAVMNASLAAMNMNIAAETLTEWYGRMTAGYKAAFPLKTFKSQLKTYRKNIENAEKTLHKIIFSQESSPKK